MRRTVLDTMSEKLNVKKLELAFCLQIPCVNSSSELTVSTLLLNAAAIAVFRNLG